MEISTVTPQGRQHIEKYHDAGFVISGRSWGGAILVLPDRVLDWSTNAAPVDAPALEPARELLAEVDILIVGTGRRFVLVTADALRTVRSWGPVLEAMDTPAACRTYNLLLAEGRRVAAALKPSGPI